MTRYNNKKLVPQQLFCLDFFFLQQDHSIPALATEQFPLERAPFVCTCAVCNMAATSTAAMS